MTRWILTIAFMLLAPLVLSAGQEEGEPTARFPLKVETALSVNGSLEGAYLSADPSVVWKPGLFAAGIGAEMIFGASQFEITALPYLRLELGWFYLAGGYVVTLLPGVVETLPAGFAVGAGIAPDPFSLGYGRLGFEFLLDTSVTQVQAAYGATTASRPLLAFLQSVALGSRLGIGITYSFML